MTKFRQNRSTLMGRSAGQRQTDRQTDTQTRVTTIYFASSTTHAKCNQRRVVEFWTATVRVRVIDGAVFD